MTCAGCPRGSLALVGAPYGSTDFPFPGFLVSLAAGQRLGWGMPHDKLTRQLWSQVQCVQQWVRGQGHGRDGI